MVNTNGAAGIAYQAERIRYLTEITRMFGGYKKRAWAFLMPQPAHAILDVGCGTGDDLLAVWPQLGPAARLYGLDNDPAMVAEAQKRAAATGAGIQWRVGDAAALPYESASMDRVRADRVFQHLQAPAQVLAEMKRVTRPNGWIMAADLDWGTLVLSHPQPALTAKLLEFHRSRLVNGCIGRQLWGLFNDAGLADVEVYCESFCTTDWELLRFITGLDGYLKHAVDAGALAPGEAQLWLDGTAQAQITRTFCAALTGFVVRGRVG